MLGFSRTVVIADIIGTRLAHDLAKALRAPAGPPTVAFSRAAQKTARLPLHTHAARVITPLDTRLPRLRIIDEPRVSSTRKRNGGRPSAYHIRYSHLAQGAAAIAQMVEHVIRNDGVGGSIPSCGTNKINNLSQF